MIFIHSYNSSLNKRIKVNHFIWWVRLFTYTRYLWHRATFNLGTVLRYWRKPRNHWIRELSHTWWYWSEYPIQWKRALQITFHDFFFHIIENLIQKQENNNSSYFLVCGLQYDWLSIFSCKHPVSWYNWYKMFLTDPCRHLMIHCCRHY